MSFDAALAESLYTHAPLATFIVRVDAAADLSERFRYDGWNPACQRLTGLSDEDTRGRTPRDLVPWLSEETARAIEARYQACTDAAAPLRYDDPLTLDGRQTYWITTLVPVLGSDGAVQYLVGTSEEVTEFKWLETCLVREQEEQVRFARRLRQLHRLSTTSYPSVEALADDYLTTGTDILGLPIGILSRIEGDTYTVRACVSPDGAPFPGATFALADVLCADVADDETTVHYPDLSRVPHLREHPAYVDQGLTAYISTPVWVEGRVSGTLSFSGPEARPLPFTEEDVELIELMADGIGHFLELECARRRAEEAQREAEAARDVAEAASRAKSAFLSTMSHEIRTPLTGVLGFAALLRSDSSLAPQHRHYADIIGRSGDQLVSLVNDVLDIARIEADALTLHAERAHVPTLVRDSLELHAASAEERGVGVGFEIERDVPAQVLTDGRRLRQVLGNLVSNAVAFTRDGQVTVRVSTAGASGLAPGRSLLRFEVEDTGVGIDPAALPRIFDSFYQADRYAGEGRGGTGLGLAICQKLVGAMGGTISADSRPGHGTTVTFTVEVGLQAERQVVVGTRSAVELQGRRALVLDPNAANRELLQTLLRRWGVEARAVGTGGEALALVASDGPFDVALIEHSLPGETGIDVARQLAVDGAALPVVLLSSLDGDLAATEPSIQATIRKPLDARTLEATLRRALAADAPAATVLSIAPDDAPGGDGLSFEGRDDHGGPQVPAVIVAAPQRVDRGLRVIVAEDDETNRDLIGLFLGGLGVRPDFAVHGADLLDRLEADPGYDLIFMDIMMPVMDGMEATREVIARYGDARPRIVALTARALPEDQQRVLANGVDGFIAKPFSREDLRQALDDAQRRGAAPTPPTIEVSLSA